MDESLKKGTDCQLNSCQFGTGTTTDMSLLIISIYSTDYDQLTVPAEH